MTTMMTRKEMATENNLLGLQENDLVLTKGKGIGIVLPKPSLDGELVVYSLSSFMETHPNDDDGMAKVRRYNEDGSIALYSEKTGKKLKNRDIYAIEGIVGIKSYTNPIEALKDFFNQNKNIKFDPVTAEVEEEETETVDTTETTEAPSQMDINMQILAMLGKINDKLDKLG